MEPSFQTLATSTSAVSSVDEDNTLSIAGQTDYVETTSIAKEERLCKIPGIEQTGFKLHDTDGSGNTIISDLVVSASNGFIILTFRS